ncbi:MAG: glycosyltransferase [Armatimonadota bacterium]|nr:glycosyltransferase [Armatimonadota bacterium]MDR7485703.1 glycosyltransferase [Armatimonadota bacterium]MDR7533096.1 glycosyltransferase [Armatimonadota bacterium]MDR7535872.1 glycosyltransferase [Armatimonadota bacterium]
MTTERAGAATGPETAAAGRVAEAPDASRAGGLARDAFDASVIISTYNCRQELGDMLADLAAQEGAFEVLLVDDGSTDGTAEMLETLVFPRPLRIFRQSNLGLCIARNRAAHEARGRVLLFLDPDLRLASGLVAAHLRHHREQPRLAVQGPTIQDPATLRTTFMRARYLLPALPPRRRQDISHAYVAARNFSVARDAFIDVGGFDETFRGYGFDDIDLAYRLRQAGVRIVYEPAAVVRHVHVLDLAGVMRRQREAGWNAVHLWRKHGRPHNLALLAEIHPLLLPLKWLVYRTGVVTRLVRTVLTWAERHALLPLCSECYNHLIWRAYYEGVAAGLRAGRGPDRGGSGFSDSGKL